MRNNLKLFLWFLVLGATTLITISVIKGPSYHFDFISYLAIGILSFSCYASAGLIWWSSKPDKIRYITRRPEDPLIEEFEEIAYHEAIRERISSN